MQLTGHAQLLWLPSILLQLLEEGVLHLKRAYCQPAITGVWLCGRVWHIIQAVSRFAEAQQKSILHLLCGAKLTCNVLPCLNCHRECTSGLLPAIWAAECCAEMHHHLPCRTISEVVILHAQSAGSQLNISSPNSIEQPHVKMRLDLPLWVGGLPMAGCCFIPKWK